MRQCPRGGGSDSDACSWERKDINNEGRVSLARRPSGIAISRTKALPGKVLSDVSLGSIKGVGFGETSILSYRPTNSKQYASHMCSRF